MSGYHITPSATTGQSRRLRCVAGLGNCKYGDAPHFETKAAADQFIAFQEELEQAASKARLDRLHSSNPSIESALRSDLNHKGPKPAWWSKFHDEIAGDEDLPCEPELLDVIDSPVGKLAVVWQETITGAKPAIDWHSQIKGGWGLKLLSLRSVETGETLGYLKLGYRSKETFARSFGTDELAPFRFQRQEGGSYYHDDDDMDADLTTLSSEEREALDRRLWMSSVKGGRGAFQRTDGEWVANYQLTEKDIPTDYATVKVDLDKFAKQIRKQMAAVEKTHEQPYVDFSRVGEDKELQGMGLGTTLYVFGARKLATQGKAIKASGTQTDEAKAAWVRFAKNFPEQVKSYTYTHVSKYSTKKIVGKLLDFR